MRINLHQARTVINDLTQPLELAVEAGAIIRSSADATTDDIAACRRWPAIVSEVACAGAGCVAILEDNRDRVAVMREQLAQLLPACSVEIFGDAPSMIAWLRDRLAQVVLISLDHDLNETQGTDELGNDAGTGRDVTDFLASILPTCAVIVHSTNATAALAMVQQLRTAGWPVSRIYPHDDVQWIRNDWAQEIGALRSRGFVVDHEPPRAIAG